MNNNVKMVSTNLRCPKCKSNNLLANEIWVDHSIQWDVEDGKFDREDGILEPGSPHHVEAECKSCHHLWRVRNAKQIDSIVNFY